MKYCHECGNQIEKHMKFCGQCGADQKIKEKRKVFIILVFIFLIVVIACGVWFVSGVIFPDSKEQALDETDVKNIEEENREYVVEDVKITEQENGDIAEDEYAQAYKMIEVRIQNYDRNGNVYFEYQEIYQYNEKGNLKKGKIYSKNSDGSIYEGNIKTVYNKDDTYLTIVEGVGGDITKTLRDCNEKILWQKRYNLDGTLVYEAMYGKNEKKLSERDYNSDGTLFYEKLYDNFGNATEENWPDGVEVVGEDDDSGKKMYKRQGTYDEYGNLLEEVGYDESGKDYWYEKWQNSYDVNGNLIEAIGYDCNGEIFLRKSKSYDEYGNLTIYMEYDVMGNILLNKNYQYQYDQDRNIVLKKCYSEGTIESTEKYDNHGNVIELHYYDENNRICSKEELKYQVFKIPKNN